MLQFLKSRPEIRCPGTKTTQITRSSGVEPWPCAPGLTPNTGGTGCYARAVASEAERNERAIDAGVLGSLPSRRPGVESPRRAEARQAAADRAGASRAAGGQGDAQSGEGPSGLEELARAGVGLATGTAAAGLKLAGRAAGGPGRGVGRR
jgi:hypothetical protein